MELLTGKDAHAACVGGGVYACGGGGWLDHGLQNGQLAVTLGKPKLVPIDEIKDEGVIVTISAIGAPAAEGWEMWPRDYIRAFELIRDAIKEPIVGVMNAQNGYSSSVNCWLPAAAHDIPIVDAAGDVRAHPTIKMGAMGYANDSEFKTVQAVVGGNRADGRYLEVVAHGNLFRTANILRKASVESGGFIASARLPLPVAVVKERAALGSISLAIRTGKAMLNAESKGAAAVIEAILEQTGGRILGQGTVTEATLHTDGGFDHARFFVDSPKGMITIYVMNEHMAVDCDGERLATYPDVISLLDVNTGLPLPAGKTIKGMRVAILVVDYRKLPTSASALDPAAFPEVEKTLGIELSRFVFHV